jgi:hypothetical protein
MVRTLVIDNFSAPCEDGPSRGPTFKTHEEAVEYCKRIVDDFLQGELDRGSARECLWQQYTSFGETPLVLTDDIGQMAFSGWEYARVRCEELQFRERAR